MIWFSNYVFGLLIFFDLGERNYLFGIIMSMKIEGFRLDLVFKFLLLKRA